MKAISSKHFKSNSQMNLNNILEAISNPNMSVLDSKALCQDKQFPQTTSHSDLSVKPQKRQSANKSFDVAAALQQVTGNPCATQQEAHTEENTL